MSLGWSRAVIDEMTLPEVYAFSEYWKESPPVHISVAAYLGIGGKGKHAEVADIGMLMQEANIMNGAM